MPPPTMSNSKDSGILNPMRAAQPRRITFDPYNSTTKGHQVAETPAGGTAWQELRTAKLGEQFGISISRLQRTRARRSAITQDENETERYIVGSVDCVENPSDVKSDCTDEKKQRQQRRSTAKSESQMHEDTQRRHQLSPRRQPLTPKPRRPPRIFDRLVFYVNGSTHPLISDHKLKHLIAAHGGSLALGLKRRAVTHVILGSPNSQVQPRADAISEITSSRAGAGGITRGNKGHPEIAAAKDHTGAGGGLAAGKIQREIARVRGGGISSNRVRFVRVEWLLECVKKGSRLPEARFAVDVPIAGSGQRSVLGMLSRGDEGQDGDS